MTAHRLLMTALVDDAGRFRSGGVGIFQGKQLVHMVLPADRVPQQMDDLLDWLKHTDEHPLVASCVFHYEHEFMLQALHNAIQQAIATDRVTDQVARIIQAFAAGELGSAGLMKALDLTHKPTFRENYLDPAMEGG